MADTPKPAVVKQASPPVVNHYNVIRGMLEAVSKEAMQIDNSPELSQFYSAIGAAQVCVDTMERKAAEVGA